MTISGALEDISNQSTTSTLSSDNTATSSNSGAINEKAVLKNKQPSPNKSLPILARSNSAYHSTSANTASNSSTITSSNSASQSCMTHPSSAREYVESLHQNSKSQLIYGKNHVIVRQKDTEFAGYLSLHLNPAGLILKWTPNQLMNSQQSFDDSSAPQQSQFSQPSSTQSSLPKTQSGYWDYAMYVDMNTIVYLHCHQQADDGATIVLVAPDGVQYPPIKFPKGSHLLQFLTCLENGLAPNGQLDPPLWNEIGKGKIFPKIQRRRTAKEYKKSSTLKPKMANIESSANCKSFSAGQKTNYEIDIEDEAKCDQIATAASVITSDLPVAGDACNELSCSSNSSSNVEQTATVLPTSSMALSENDLDEGDSDQVDDFVFRIVNSNLNGDYFLNCKYRQHKNDFRDLFFIVYIFVTSPV